MIYRQADGFVGDLDARARLMDVAREGSALRAQAERRRADAERKREAAERRAQAEQAARERQAEAERAQALRLAAVTDRSWLADWTISLIAASIPLGLVVFTLPVWIDVLEIGFWTIGLAIGPSLVPVAITLLARHLAGRTVERERQWAAGPQGHWEMLGTRCNKRVMTIHFRDQVPGPGLTADVIAAVARKLGDGGATLARTEVVEVSGRTVTLRAHDLYHPRWYLKWCRALVGHALPVLAEVYPIHAVWVTESDS
ncbi:MAG: hypothetical protein KJO07_02945 [Deltaproteobacteria bacterium]|nr:hypothetical protein [Deltaproteobacteria bacterium]